MASLLGRARDLDPMTPPPPVSFQVLVFHKTAGFRHDSIPAGIAAITTLGLEHGYSVEATDDASVFTESGLADYDAIVFLSTTRDILDAGQEQAMESFIEAGNGFVGIHSATDTEYDWSWYGGLVGAYFANHPATQSATIDVVEPTHPTMQGLPPSFVRFDEWYDFRSVPGPGVTILATLDESSYVGGNMGDPHPIVWAHEYDGGRSFYTAFGHTEETFSEPIVLTQLNNAILWGRSWSGRGAASRTACRGPSARGGQGRARGHSRLLRGSDPHRWQCQPEQT